MPTTRDTSIGKLAKIVKAIISDGEKVSILIPGIGTTLLYWNASMMTF